MFCTLRCGSRSGFGAAQLVKHFGSGSISKSGSGFSSDHFINILVKKITFYKFKFLGINNNQKGMLKKYIIILISASNFKHGNF
jgi:hypothetical protein